MASNEFVFFRSGHRVIGCFGFPQIFPPQSEITQLFGRKILLHIVRMHGPKIAGPARRIRRNQANVNFAVGECDLILYTISLLYFFPLMASPIS